MENRELSIALEAILQCRAVNPENPLAAAKEIGNMVEALKQAGIYMGQRAMLTETALPILHQIAQVLKNIEEV